MTLRPLARSHVRTTGKWNEMLHFLASVGACNLIMHIYVVVNWQLSKQSLRWSVSHDRIAGPGYMFWRVYHLQFSSFQLIAGPTIIGFLYCNVFSLRGPSPLASAKYIYCTLQNEWNTLGCSPGTTGGTATAHMKWDIIPLRRYKHCHSYDQYTAGTYKLHIPAEKMRRYDHKSCT